MSVSIIRMLFAIGIFVAGSCLSTPSLLWAQGETANKSGTVPAVAPEGGTPESEDISTYVINPLDRLLIVIYAGDKQTGEYTRYIQSDGTVYLPFLEQDVKLGGLMLLEAQRKLENISRKFIKEPRVVITVISSFSRNVSTYGKIANRNVELNTPMRVLQVIARVGGPLDGAIDDSIRVISNDGSVRLFNYRKVNRNPSSAENFLLKPGDIIFVPGADDFSVMVFGGVRNSGVYRLKTGDRVLDALMRAGSWVGTARIDKVRILRTRRGTGVEVTHSDLNRLFEKADTSQNHVLKDGDIIFIPEKGPSIFQPITVIMGTIYTALLTYSVYLAVKR